MECGCSITNTNRRERMLFMPGTPSHDKLRLSFGEYNNRIGR